MALLFAQHSKRELLRLNPWPFPHFSEACFTCDAWFQDAPFRPARNCSAAARDTNPWPLRVAPMISPVERILARRALTSPPYFGGMKMTPEPTSSIWSNRIPIFIGLSGSRFFDKRDASNNERLAQRAKTLIQDCFEKLDRNFPDTPKILLTGGALGADLIATEVVESLGENWRIALVLALEPALMSEDFDPPMPTFVDYCTKAQRRFQRLTTEDLGRRVVVKTLPRLRRSNAAGAQERFSSEELSRWSAAYDRRARHEHYEQVGQWIAEAATILLAVATEEAIEQGKTADANGASQRVIAVRRQGRAHDTAGRGVACRSDVLYGEWSEVSPPPPSYAWWIDPAEKSAAPYGVSVFGPVGVKELTEADHRPRRGKIFGPHHEQETGPNRPLEASLAVVKAFERFNARAPRLTDDAWSRAPDGCPLQTLAAIREVLSIRIAFAKWRSHLAFVVLAGCFVAAVLCFEIFAKFSPSCPGPLGAYLVVLGSIGCVLLIVHLKRWEPLYEDYRAVSELLRVQRAWWAAGLSNRVDREHLLGIDSELAPVRDAVTAILSWVWLRSCWRDDVPSDSFGVPAEHARAPSRQSHRRRPGRRRPPGHAHVRNPSGTNRADDRPPAGNTRGTRFDGGDAAGRS